MVSSGEVEAVKNDELMEVDHPDSGLCDVLLQNCLRQTSFHLCRQTDARLSFGQLSNLEKSPLTNISGCPLGGLLGLATLCCKHLVAAVAPPS